MRRRGDEFERLAMPHARSLLRFALRLTRNSSSAEDLVQQTLLLAWRSFDQFQPGTNIHAWLFRILVNTHHSETRKTRAWQAPVALTPDLRSSAASSQEYLEVMQALERLSSDHRTALLLAAVEGFTCREIAGILAVPMGTVMSRLSRAREAMRESLSARRDSEKVAR